MKYNFKPSGVCSYSISFEIDEETVKNVEFKGGCSGNTQAIQKLCEGRKAKDIINLLKGIKCGYKETSCPDQLAKAIESSIK